jgi:serine/threonine protein kinase
MKNENNKINEIEENINENINNNKEKIIRNFNFLKENKIENKEKEVKSPNNVKIRALSTAPIKTRKSSKKATINIDCNNPNKENKITNENINSPKADNNKEINNDKSIKKDKLSKYEIGDSLGKGAYAIVKLVTNKLTKEKFAMKIYEKEKLNSNSKKNCVYKEIQILKKLKHKNIVKLIEVISTEKQILIVQELIEGISLREYYNNEIRNQKGISIHKENIFRIIFRQIFEAMDYLHKQGMAHRDIKLENILIKKNYEIKIIDFGFGMYNPENKLQKFFCGTPNYMPPEIAEKKPYIGQLADMWSLGILVYKIFCADFPFKGKDEKELYKAIKHGKFTMASYTPDYARKIICSLIVLNPNKRMTCEDVLNSDWLKNK